MRLAPLLLTFAVLAAGAGCHAGPDADRYRTREPEAADPDASLPTPFTAAQIRDATPAGRRFRFRVTTEGVVSIEIYMEFIEVDEDGCRVRTSTLRDSGEPLSDPEEQSFTWEALRRHALFPAGTTRITEGEVAVRGGAYQCLIYTTTTPLDGGVTVTRSWFAKDLPGPPVKQTVKLDGKLISETELLGHDLP